MPRALPTPMLRCSKVTAPLLLALACAHEPTRTASERPVESPGTRSAPAAAAPTPAAPPPNVLEGLRADADAVLRAQGERYWRLFTEGKQADPAAAWRGREGLLSDRSLAAVRAARDSGAGDRRASAYLAAWLLGERLARDAAGPLGDLATAREQASFTWSDHPVALRSVPALLAGERDRQKRRALSEAEATAASGLVPLAQRGEQRIAAVARELGYPSPLALAAELRGAPAAALGAMAEDVLARTEAPWQQALESLARAEGLSRRDVRLHDLPRLLRTQVPARMFPAGRHVTMGATLLAGMGIDLAAQANLRLSPGPHAGAPPVSIVLPVDPPGDVRLAVAALAGLDAARAALHELGAAQYYAHLRGGSMELRRLGPASVPQAWGLVLEEVTGSGRWLAAQGVPEAQARAEARVAAARRLLRARERAGRVLLALARAGNGAAAREAALLARVTGCPARLSDAAVWLVEPDPLLRAAEGLRAELLAAQLEGRLAREAGAPEWWRSPAAGAWLVGAWAGVAGRTAEELSASLGEKALDAEALVRVARERAAP